MLTIAAVLGFKEQFKPTQPILDIFSNIECKEGIDQFESVRPAFILVSGKQFYSCLLAYLWQRFEKEVLI
jgi:hypothetical protein